MKFADKLPILRNLITDTLNPLIGKKYVLVDCPYYSNIGDQLIWEGEKSFLKEYNRNCVSYSSRNYFKYPELEREVTILFQGGGNLGNLYREHFDFLLSIMNQYPHNRIVIFPQTIFYSNPNICLEDANSLNKHADLHFCIRDKKGFQLMKKNGLRNIYLLPDMAFCIPLQRLRCVSDVPVKGSLYLKRVDKELLTSTVDFDVDFIKDWPTFEGRVFDGIFFAKVLNKLATWRIPFSSEIWNHYADTVYRKNLIDIGRDFINSYDPIISTRLHAIILALMCGKSVTAIDNSYGKISEFVKTWLYDIEELTILNK